MKNIISAILLFALATVCVARPIEMYEQPKSGSKAVGKIDSASGIMIIFSPKDNKAWTKVADPKNGNVGWVKTSELGHDGFSYSVVTTGDGAGSYRVFQYGSGIDMTSPKKVQDDFTRMQLRQQTMQRDMQHMMNDMFNSFYYPAPFIMPVLVVPEKSMQAKPVKAKAVEKKVNTKAAPAKVKAVTPAPLGQ
tara:strand:- start:786 stop:1361 length:576 start_codon:yes stop_codon:yes gene_type:complete